MEISRKMASFENLFKEKHRWGVVELVAGEGWGRGVEDVLFLYSFSLFSI